MKHNFKTWNYGQKSTTYQFNFLQLNNWGNTKLRNDLEESIKHLEEVNDELNQDLDKLENDLKMGLEEEKMLRGQDIGILKFNLNEGMVFN